VPRSSPAPARVTRGSKVIEGKGSSGGDVTTTKVGGGDENTILENDVLVMGLKLGMLQQENFDLEQSNQSLRVEVKQLREESAKKSKVIAKQLRGIKNPETEFWTSYQQQKTSGASLSFVGSLFSNNNESPALQKEMNTKMGTVLEETLLHNIQLQEDLRNVATENENLKEQLAKIK